MHRCILLCHVWCASCPQRIVPRPAEESYDLRKDPHQTRNVAASAQYAASKTNLAAQLMKILKDAGDPRVTGDGQTFERPPFTNPTPEQPRPRGQSR